MKLSRIYDDEFLCVQTSTHKGNSKETILLNDTYYISLLYLILLKIRGEMWSNVSLHRHKPEGDRRS